MTESVSGNTTLPSVDLVSSYRPEEQLVLTVLFHPDTSRIGESVQLPEQQPGCVITLGREQPQFSRRLGTEPGQTRGLSDPHVSRRALLLRSSKDGLELSRPAGASRCRIAGANLSGAISLSPEQLRQGRVFCLGHAIVLYLKLTRIHDGDRTVEDDLGLIGESDGLVRLRSQVVQAARSDADVLICGESGSGKERVARALHSFSARSQGPFVPVNMAAIPEELAAAALFGNTRGAFTGATASQPGLFRQAEGGTLFLDEIGDAPATVQPLLLRALQEREIQVVGGGVCPVDVRVVAATDLDLEAPSSGFRTALRHRLAGLEIAVPPLSQHVEDIGRLAWEFYHRHRQDADSTRSADVRVAPGEAAHWAELIALLAEHPWPGNVRELENTMRQVALAGESVPRIPAALYRRGIAAVSAVSAVDEGTSVSGPTTSAPMTDSELKQAMAECRFEVSAAARQLGMSRQSLYRRIQSSPDLRLAADVPLPELLQALETARGNLQQTALDLEVSATALRTRLRSAGLSAAGHQPG